MRTYGQIYYREATWSPYFSQSEEWIEYRECPTQLKTFGRNTMSRYLYLYLQPTTNPQYLALKVKNHKPLSNLKVLKIAILDNTIKIIYEIQRYVDISVGLWKDTTQRGMDQSSFSTLKISRYCLVEGGNGETK